jgi:hypothetical protein
MSKLRQSAIVAAITRNNGFLQLAADELRCTRQALWLRAQHSQAVREAIVTARERAREDRVRAAESCIDRLLAKDHFGAAEFTLSRQGRDRGWAPDKQGSHSQVAISFEVRHIIPEAADITLIGRDLSDVPNQLADGEASEDSDVTT